MSRYIDIDKAIPIAIQAVVDVVGHGISQVDAVHIADKFEEAPTIDAVEVVRCKDCKQCESYYPSKKEGEEPYPLLYECKRERKCVFPTDFCSYGERKEK